MEVWPGEPYPLGATYDGAGTNFSIFSEAAERVELCLFGPDGGETRLDMAEVTAYAWHSYLPRIGPGQIYGFRVHGPWDPERGFWCNENKLLLDPYTKAVEGSVEWADAVFGYEVGKAKTVKSKEDSAPFVPKSVVASPYFEWGDDRHPRTELHKSVVYELHVKGFTQLHPDVPPEMRGTYAGLTHTSVLEHFAKMGITAVELQPVHQFVHDHALVRQGLRNYWGYNSIAYLAPHNEYRSSVDAGRQVQEFKQMVKTLHAHGIEVILDVVYNHTGEGAAVGPLLSLKGIDNPTYYRLNADDPSTYVDYTGTGNSLNVRHPHVLQLIMDSLRYWVVDMHVDGFRFDLAATLARELHDVDRLSAFFDIIQQDPVISQVKLIAEPWDVGEGGYQVGNFPPQWSEWNGKYRDTVRDFWRGKEQTLGEFASRLTGSSDLYESTGRTPSASVNFVTCHDGFTLTDLVSYNEKHNAANGEDNKDGENYNTSWNCGVEGPTDHTMVNTIRARQKRNFLATLLLSQGVPMLLAGDELGRTQIGNNNAYCQDNDISWVDWDNVDEELLEFASWLTRFREDHPVFQRRRWFQGQKILGRLNSGIDDIGWFRNDGHRMTDADWDAPFAKSIGIFLNGEGISDPGPHGQRVEDSSFFVIFNAHSGTIDFSLPPKRWGRNWKKRFDTSDAGPKSGRRFAAEDVLKVQARAVILLERVD